MSSPTFGLEFQTVDNEPRPAIAADMSVIGLVGTAPDADAAAFPLDTPVLVFSDDTVTLTKLGAGGTLKAAIELINAQLGEFQASAKIVVVRVGAQGNEAVQLTTLAGSPNLGTGVWALLDAGPLLGVTPRLIAVPGFTKQSPQGVTSIAVTSQGSGYTTPPTVALTGGGGSGAAAVAVVEGGKVVAVNVTRADAGYTSAPTVAFSGGGGTGAAATASIGPVANSVVAVLPSTLDRLLAVAVVSGPATTLQAYTDWRETFSHKRLIPLETAAKVGATGVVVDAAPAVLGIAVRRDHEKGGRPFHSWANQAINGIVGPNRPLRFSLTDGATDGQSILALNGGVILRGEAGVETAIASGGFIYVGTDTASEDDLWRFYNVVRGRDYIHLLLLRTLRFYLGRFNLTGQTIEAVLNTMRFALRDLQADGDLLGYTVGFSRAQNSPEQLRLGSFTVSFAAEEPPVLRRLGIQSSRYRPALDALLDDLLAQIDQTTASAA